MVMASFEWDPEKDADNQRKHGVSFARAQHAFADRCRVIAGDLSHSETEERFYCFGMVDGGGSHGAVYLPCLGYSYHRRRVLAQRKSNL